MRTDVIRLGQRPVKIDRLIPKDTYLAVDKWINIGMFTSIVSATKRYPFTASQLRKAIDANGIFDNDGIKFRITDLTPEEVLYVQQHIKRNTDRRAELRSS